MDYDQLTDEQKRRIIEADLLAFEAQLFQAELRLDVARSNVAHLEAIVERRQGELAALVRPPASGTIHEASKASGASA